MAETEYYAVRPDGSPVTRKSHRLYTHLMTYRTQWPDGYSAWTNRWCSRPDLAEKERRAAVSLPHTAEAHVLEVQVR